MGIVKRIKDAAYNAYDTASNALAGAELSGMAARGLGKINAIRRSPAGKAIERAARSPRGRAVGSLVKRSGRLSLGALALELLDPVARSAARSASRSLAERTMGKTSYSGYRDAANGFDADNTRWRQKMRRSANPKSKTVKPLGFMCGGKVPSRRGR
jgi:hypothetical protein